MATGTTAEQIIDVVTPAAGESVSEGTILEWRVKVGEFIKATDTIVEISTDKVDVELPSPASGTITEILVEEGDTVTVGQVIARIAAGDSAATGDGSRSAQAAASTPQTSPAPAPAAEKPAQPVATEAPVEAPAQPDSSAGDGGGVTAAQPGTAPPATPVAQRAAAAEGVDLAEITGSGPSGRIT